MIGKNSQSEATTYSTVLSINHLPHWYSDCGRENAISMTAGSSNHQFAGATISQVHGLSSHHCELTIRQGPQKGKAIAGKEKDRKPIDPPPIIQLKVSKQIDKNQNFLQSPYFFMTVSLLPEPETARIAAADGHTGTALTGTLVSSLHRLKDTDNEEGAFFIFGDLSVKLPGRYRLQFTLYGMRQDECAFITLEISDPFPVLSQKSFSGMSESTHLTRSFSDQGVRLRIRKEPRTLLRKRGPADDNYEPRHYNRRPSTNGIQQVKVAACTQEHRQRNNEDHIEYNEPQGAWVQRPIPSRQFAQPSTTPFHPSTGSSYDDQQPAKRPPTGSDQHHSSTMFDQSHSSQPDSSFFPPRPFHEGQQLHNQYASSQPAAYGSYSHTHSPLFANTSRPHYFPNRTGSTGTSPTFDASISRSPQEAQFPPQAQGFRYSSMASLPYNTLQQPSLASRHENSQHFPQAIAIGPNPPGYGTLGNFGMPPMVRYSAAPESEPPRRQDYQLHSGAGSIANIPAGNVGTGLYSQP